MSPRHSQARSIPILTDIVSRGAKAPEDANIDMILTPDDEAEETFESPYDVGSEEPTVLPVPPGAKAKQEQPPEKSFSLDELTEVPVPAEGDGESNEIIQQAMAAIMPQLESMVRESLQSILAEKGTESSTPEKPNDKAE